MSALILAAAVLTTPVAAPPQPECRDLRPIQTREGARRNAPRKLVELPPADLYRAVLRRTGPCDVVEVFVDGTWKKLPAGPMPEPRPANKGW